MNRVSISEHDVQLRQKGLRRSVRLQPGIIIESLSLSSIHSESIRIPDAQRLIHLQFRRFAGCPVCDLHLRTFAQRHHELTGLVQEVVVFHSSKTDLLRYAGQLPFAVIADPGKELYRAFGVESGSRSLLNPRAWLPIAKAVAKSIQRTLLRRQPLPPLGPEGGSLGLPADFLIAPDGRLVAAKYAAHAFDQWSVDEVVQLAARKYR